MSNNFKVEIHWQPENKPFTYNDYSREYTIESEHKVAITGTAAPEYKGSKEYYNPEELLIASLSGCHMLYYLALAANSKIHVKSYRDQADGMLEKHGMSMKFKEVTLRPKVMISPESDKDKAHALFEKAHSLCFIANSMNFPVKVEAEIVKE